MITKSCRLSIETATIEDVLLNEAWELAEDVFLDPSDHESRAKLKAVNARIDAYREGKRLAGMA